MPKAISPEVESGCLPQPRPANIESLDELDISLDAKGTSSPCAGLYPRDGTPDHTYLEEQLSVITTPDRKNVISWVSGMAAVRETVLFASDHQGSYKTGVKIAYGRELYSQSVSFFSKLKRMGVEAKNFDSGNSKIVSSIIKEKKADVIFAETVANTPNMPVLDIPSLLEDLRREENPPLVILDNTLPLKSGLDLSSELEPTDPVIVVESATKNAMNNYDLLGVSYGENNDLMDGLRAHQANSGAAVPSSHVEKVANILDQTLPSFNERNNRVFNSTNQIARALIRARNNLGDTTDFITVFPADPSHGNYDIARGLINSDGNFPSPVVFATPTELSDSASRELIKRFVNHPRMREQISEGQIQSGAIHLGQSFGMPKARILYDRNAPNVRFAGGYDIDDEQALAQAIEVVAADVTPATRI